MKRKTLTLSLCLLAILSLVGIGFAAWQITKPAEDKTLNGTVEAYVAETIQSSVSLSWKDGKSQFIFGLPKGLPAEDNRTYKWFSYDSTAGMEEDVLTLTLVISVDTSKVLDDAEFYVYLTPSDMALYQEVFNNTIAKSLGGTLKDTDAVEGNDKILLATLSKSDFTNGVKEITLATDWGPYFGGNPYTVYGNQEYDATTHKDVETNLDILAKIEKLGFTLLVTSEELVKPSGE